MPCQLRIAFRKIIDCGYTPPAVLRLAADSVYKLQMEMVCHPPYPTLPCGGGGGNFVQNLSQDANSVQPQASNTHAQRVARVCNCPTHQAMPGPLSPAALFAQLQKGIFGSSSCVVRDYCHPSGLPTSHGCLQPLIQIIPESQVQSTLADSCKGCVSRGVLPPLIILSQLCFLQSLSTFRPILSQLCCRIEHSDKHCA